MVDALLWLLKPDIDVAPLRVVAVGLVGEPEALGWLRMEAPPSMDAENSSPPPEDIMAPSVSPPPLPLPPH